MYHAYLPNALAGEDFALSADIAEVAARAERAIIELNDDPPTVANLDALTRQLLRAESVASSRIEGLILSHRRLARAAFTHDARDITAQSVIANIAALEHAVTLASDADELTTNDLLETHRMLFAGTRDEHLGGLVRTQQNWIGGAASSPRRAEFVPPPPERVAALLDDLCEFCNRRDIPTVIQAAIAHAQFETIHPFHDGNGRVGRALILIILRRRGIAPRYLPPVSLVLAGEADRYIAALTSWRTGDDDDWFNVFADAVEGAATGARAFANDVVDLQTRWIKDAGTPRESSGPLQLIRFLPSHPIVNVKTTAHLLGGTKERARQSILRLEKAGVLRQVTVVGRNRAWECVGMFDLLDRFERDLGPEERAPRPTR